MDEWIDRNKEGGAVGVHAAHVPMKQRILDAWIMTERLSEGQIKLKNNNMNPLSEAESGNYYTYFKQIFDRNKAAETSEKSGKSGKSEKAEKAEKGINSGIVIYFDVFPFEEVVSLLGKKFGLDTAAENYVSEEKFSCALFFDASLALDARITFFTASGYIYKKREIPNFEMFEEYEADQSLMIECYFENSQDHEEQFNEAMRKTIEFLECDPSKSYVKFIQNQETEAIHFHSFFVDDLTKAKSITTGNLEDYLFGNKRERCNLDSCQHSPSFCQDIFERILQPSRYPFGRFPASTSFALSFMQQVAVNLALGYGATENIGSHKIQSVNGPPGTGKTTLLKDIFADLIVKQAYTISRLMDKNGSKKLKDQESYVYYGEDGRIVALPSDISENNIVVASSNNGAIQNIVNELPLESEIDPAYIPILNQADYFSEIANDLFEKKNGKNWGLFSMEGGKKMNMETISFALKCIVRELNDIEYRDDPDVYDEFKKRYSSLKAYRKGMQEYSDRLAARVELIRKLSKEGYIQEEGCFRDIYQVFKEVADQHHAWLPLVKETCDKLKKELQNVDDMILHIGDEIEKLPKPFFFSFRSAKIRYQRCVKELEAARCNHSDNRHSIARCIELLEQNIASEAEPGTDLKESDLFAGESLLKLFSEHDYEQLQLSNPWFEEEYRKRQSELFILALRVRKQFLRDNVRNIKAAAIIWYKQSYQIGQGRGNLIPIAWDWINFTIPVIGSTFASFSRMFKNLPECSLGHLFIDEAGQALPQSAVGAIFRARHVMAVGDPSQIKPVLTLDEGVLGFLARTYGVNEIYLSENASVQTLADRASQYGFYRDAGEDESWIGIPLWVHRRCADPMFSISNAISYGGRMVQANHRPGRIGWYDVRGTAQNKFVQEQADFLLDILSRMIEKDPDIVDHSKEDKVFIITPFTYVANRLAQELKQIHFTRSVRKKATNIGTIHTFQGKQAPIVFLVLGADNGSQGAAKWAVREPNMMNVAVTRAKEEFYIIGDYDLYRKLNSEVISVTNRIIDKHGSHCPECAQGK